jgi:hypothetical protein
VALRESGDFARRGTSGPAAVRHLVATHETKVLKDADLTDLAPAAAAERYRTYAEEQLAAAVPGQPVGSMALFGLAKVAQVVSPDDARLAADQRLRATSLYRAALLTEPGNFCAANELAVLLVQDGRVEAARDLLVRSVNVAPHAATWRNLSRVHARLGEQQLAEQARQRADALPAPRMATTEPDVQWLDPQAFAQVTSATDAVMPAMPLAATSPNTHTSAAPTTTERARPTHVQSSDSMAKKPKADWTPWNSRR